MTISSQQQELVDLLRNELAEIINGDFSSLAGEDTEARAQCLEECYIQAENIGNASRLVGLEGLAECCMWLKENFQLLTDVPVLSAEVQNLVQSWGVLLLGYLQYVGDEYHEQKAVDTLLLFLSDAAWLQPLQGDAAKTIAEHFQSSVVVIDETATLYPETVTEEMISLSVGDDINPQLLRGLLTELPNQVASFERAVEQYLITEDDVQLRIAQRIAHTLKGAANVVGIRGIANLTHYLEDLLELSSKQTYQQAELKDLLQDAADCLSMISEYLIGIGPRPHNLREIVETLLQLLRNGQTTSEEAYAEQEFEAAALYSFEQTESSPSDSHELMKISESATQEELESRCQSVSGISLETSSENVLTNVVPFARTALSGTQVGTTKQHAEAVKYTKTATDTKAADTKGSSAAQLQNDTSIIPGSDTQETFDTTLNITESQAQELLRLSGESQIGNTQILSRLDVVSTGIRSAENYHLQLRQLAQDLERLIELQTAMASAMRSELNEDMDPLELERYNELNSFASQLHEVTTDAHEAFGSLQNELKSLKNLVVHQRQLGFESQELLLGIRMLPVSMYSSRFQRCVRQASRLTRKPAQLEIKGEDVLVDSRVLSTLVDPIMHLLRNAVDHGLERTSHERELTGKSPVGTIYLEFLRLGDTVVVHCRDDGCGLDYDGIARAAVDRGLVPEGTRLAEADMNALILSPGFSTRREVTQTSGRGVGLDVVNEQIRQLKGNLSITSQKGKGTTFTLVAPMSILSAHTLVVQVGDYSVSIISRALEQVIYFEPDRLQKAGKGYTYQLPGEEESLPVFRLDDLIFMHTRRAEQHTALMVLRNREGRRCAVLAESVKASEEQIIKPISRSTCKVPGTVGATILGDGQVSPVIDLYELPGLVVADTAQDTWRQRFAERLRHLDNDVAKDRPIALVVDDSLSARRSLAQFVGDMGMEVYTAKDGFEAIQVIQQRMPSVILVDLEMPRMNGLELTSHLRGNKETKDIPIIMITSRATEKHKSMAVRAGVNTYLNKPWTDEELMNSIQSQIA